jgi:drug/metabolite transporter (DMT)-like permease
VRAAFVAPHKAAPFMPTTPLIEPTLTIAPLPRSIIAGTIAAVSKKGARTLTRSAISMRSAIDIEGCSTAWGRNRLYDRGAACRFPSGHDDKGSVGGHRDGDRRADAAGRARDQCGRVRQSQRHVKVSSRGGPVGPELADLESTVTLLPPHCVYCELVSWGLIGAFAAAVAYGAATVLQAQGVRAGGGGDDLDARLVQRLIRSTPYVAGLLLDALGFALSFVALRTLPLFTVQAIVASSLAVTAVLAVAILGARPMAREWVALLSVTAGLTLLGASARRDRPAALDGSDRWMLVASVLVVGGAAFAAGRRRHGPSTSDAWALGALAGLMYGAGGIGARMLATPKQPWQIIEDPALYAMVAAGMLGLLLYALALQRGSVTVATSAVVGAETQVPAAVGILLLGDRPAHGAAVVSAIGFGLAVLGAVALARYGQAPELGTETDRIPDTTAACPS